MFNNSFFRKSKHFLFMFNNSFFRKSYRAWDNVEKWGTARQNTDGNIMGCMRFTYWIPKATDTHSEHVILINFPRQQRLWERASILCLYITYLSCFPWRMPATLYYVCSKYPACNLTAGIIRPEILGKA